MDFHELRTIYQTVAPSDQVRVDVSKGLGIEIACKDPRVRATKKYLLSRCGSMKVRGNVPIAIEGQLPAGGLEATQREIQARLRKETSKSGKELSGSC